MVELSQHATVPLAVVRRRAAPGALPRLVPECCGLVWNALKSQGLRGGRHVALYWDDAINVDIGVEMLAPFREEGELRISATPAGEVASLAHYGPYTHLGVAHAEVLAWCEAHGRRVAGPRWEVYGHWDAAWDTHPERILTVVHYLLESV